MVDTYKGTVVASLSSANSLPRYASACAFLLFALQSRITTDISLKYTDVLLVFESLTTSWSLSLFGFLAVALMPLPSGFYRYDRLLRERSQYVVSLVHDRPAIVDIHVLVPGLLESFADHSIGRC